MPPSSARNQPDISRAELAQLQAFSASLRTSPPASPIIVLDSNVWIDILVFDDPDSRPIRAALDNATLTAINSLPCRTELERVLSYPQFAARSIDIDRTLARLDDYARLIDTARQQPNTPVLPLCSDRDDQKFLELARDGGAHWLISKDKALLKLRRRIARDFPFRIATSAMFSRVLLSSVPGDAAQTGVAA